MSTTLRFLLAFASLLFFQFAAWAQPVAGFNIVVPTSNCNPAVYSFENTSTGTGLTYEWNFGVYPGVNSVFPDPSTTYLNCGTFQVTLVVRDNGGVKDTSVQTVDIRCSPTANFTTPAATGCIPYNATFTSASLAGSGTITSYVWDFGDGNSGTGVNPSHTYLVPGCKNVTLIVVNSFNCVNDTTLNSFICINQPPVAGFTADAQTACTTPFEVNYTANPGNSAPPYSYRWTFEDGVPDTSSLPSPVVTYNNTGSFSTTLVTTDANGCADTMAGNDFITIDSNLVDFTFGSTQLCAPFDLTVNGTSPGTPLTWNWTVTAPAVVANANTQNPVIAIPDSGDYTLCVTITLPDGCVGQKCSTITVNNSPIAKFGGNQLSTCIAPSTVTFLDSSTGSNLSYSWTFPGGSPDIADSAAPPSVIYDTCGSYSVGLTVTDDKGCTSSAVKTGYVQIVCPQATYTVTPNNGCLPLTATFNSDSSTGNPVAWLWDFDDPNSGINNTSTLQNPQHTFNTEGCYTVRLTTTTAEGCTSSYELQAAVCAGWRPHANFSANPPLNCASQPIYFADSSTGTYQYTEYFWNFHTAADSIVIESYLQNPNYTYWDAGTFDITLIVSNYGCADTVTKDDYVRTLDPLSSPRVIQDCDDPLSVVLDGSSSPGATNYQWIILGGTPANATSATVPVTYPAPGDYNASLFVQNDSTGCTDLQNVVVHISTVGAEFTGSPLEGCTPLQSCFSNVSNNAVSYSWTVTDTNGMLTDTSTTASPCFTLNHAGKYGVQLVVTDSSGCRDTLYKPDYIKVSGPVADFASSSLSGCAPLEISYHDSSLTQVTGIAQWSWNFGDLNSPTNTSDFPNPAHIYNEGGNYAVRLTITDSLGCTSDTLKSVRVNNPIANMRYVTTTSCQGTQICYSADLLSPNASYYWDFGDGASASGSSACHLYTATGSFNTVLIATDTSGCSDTASTVVKNLVDILDAQFMADTTTSTCPPLVVSFSNLSAGSDSLTTWSWNFGDAQVSSLKDPFHIYTSVGKFTVTLIATDAAGCSDTLIYPDYIDITGPSAYIATPPTSGCVPHQTCMSAVSNTAVSYTWNLGDGTVIQGGDSICYTYTRTGSFFPELILSNGNNCVFSLPMGRVDVTGAVAKFGVTDSVFCEPGAVYFSDSSSGTAPVVGWNWDFGDPASGIQNNSTQANPTHLFAQAGIYHVIETITSANGCVDTATKIITVHALPSPVVTLSDAAPCAPDSVWFSGQSSHAGSVTHLWRFGDVQSGVNDTSSFQNPAHYYATAGSYVVVYSITDIHGCIGSDTAIINVQPLPVATFTAFDTCLNTQPIVFSNHTTGATAFFWSFGDGNTSTETSPVHTYQDTGIYTAQLISQSDYCADTFSTQVEIFSIPLAAFDIPVNVSCGPPAEFAMINNSVNATQYSWDFGNNTFSALEEPVAAYSTAGEFPVLLTAVNEHGCFDSASGMVTIHPNPVIQNISIEPAEGCPPLHVSFHASVTNGDTFIWDFGTDSSVQSSSPNAEYIYTDTGSYTLSLFVTSVHSCTDTLLLADTIKVQTPPVAAFDTFATNTAVYPYDGTVEFTNHSENASSYTWEFGDGNTSTDVNPVHRYESINSYSVVLTARNEYGCVDTATQELKVIKKALYVPNALHPNSSGADDLVKVWKPAGIGLHSYRAQVFDQWGKLLWQSEELTETQPSEAWDGTYLGKPCPQDVYVWKIDAVFLDRRKWEGMDYGADVGGGTKTIGSITLVR